MSAKNNSYGWNNSSEVSLYDKIKIDLKRAMLSKNEPVKNAIRIVMSEFHKITIPLTLASGKKSSRPKKPAEINNDEILNVIRGLAKSEKITLEFKKEKSSDYLNILSLYLPQMVSKEEIINWTNENIDFSLFKNQIQAIAPIMKHFGKLADGNLVKQILQEMAKK